MAMPYVPYVPYECFAVVTCHLGTMQQIRFALKSIKCTTS
jgi:hypothetical protein